MQENVFNVFKAVSVLSFGIFCFETTHASKPILYCRVLENSKVCPCFILVINKEHIQCYHTYNIIKQNITIHNITLHYITVQYITLHHITLNYITGVSLGVFLSISPQAAVNHRPEDVNNRFERVDRLHLSGQCNAMF